MIKKTLDVYSISNDTLDLNAQSNFIIKVDISFRNLHYLKTAFTYSFSDLPCALMYFPIAVAEIQF